MKRTGLGMLLAVIMLSSCVDDHRYYDQGNDDAWKNNKNIVLYAFNPHYRRGHDEARVRIQQASEFSQSMKKAGNELGDAAQDFGRSFGEFWNELTGSSVKENAKVAGE